MRDIREHRGADEVAAIAYLLATGDEGRALLPADINIIEDRFHLLLGYDGAERRLAVERGADPERLCAPCQSLDDLVMGLLLHQHAGACRADLACIEEDAGSRSFR